MVTSFGPYVLISSTQITLLFSVTDTCSSSPLFFLDFRFLSFRLPFFALVMRDRQHAQLQKIQKQDCPATDYSCHWQPSCCCSRIIRPNTWVFQVLTCVYHCCILSLFLGFDSSPLLISGHLLCLSVVICFIFRCDRATPTLQSSVSPLI